MHCVQVKRYLVWRQERTSADDEGLLEEELVHCRDYPDKVAEYDTTAPRCSAGRRDPHCSFPSVDALPLLASAQQQSVAVPQPPAAAAPPFSAAGSCSSRPLAADSRRGGNRPRLTGPGGVVPIVWRRLGKWAGCPA